MSCEKSVIECLRDKWLNPVAFASNEYSTSHRATTALNYESNDFFYTTTASIQHWTVDFTQKVAITKYSFRATSACNWINYRQASVSDRFL